MPFTPANNECKLGISDMMLADHSKMLIRDPTDLCSYEAGKSDTNLVLQAGKNKQTHASKGQLEWHLWYDVRWPLITEVNDGC